MTAVDIRRAVPSDLPAVWQIVYGIEYGGGESGPEPRDMPPLFQHELATGEMWVAETEAAVVAYAALIPRGTVGFVGEFFVRQDDQGRGIGTALLRRLLGHGMDVYCTMSSRDSSALALYIRAGLVPRWPHFLLVGRPQHAMNPDPGIQLVAARPGDPELIAWDTRIGGRFRPQDHRYWQLSLHAVPFWCARNNTVVGYAYAHPKARSGRQPARLILGPIGALTAADADACTSAMVDWAQPRAAELQIAVPAAHPSLPRLVEAGLRIRDVETFCSSRALSFFDPTAYIASTTPEGTALL